MGLELDLIDIIFIWKEAIHFPTLNVLGNLIDALRKNNTDEDIIQILKFRYVIATRNGFGTTSWEEAAFSPLTGRPIDTIIYKGLSINANPPVRLKDQEGLFQLNFYGINAGMCERVTTFRELLTLNRFRRAFPVSIQSGVVPIDNLPKRIEIPRF